MPGGGGPVALARLDGRAGLQEEGFGFFFRPDAAIRDVDPPEHRPVRSINPPTV